MPRARAEAAPGAPSDPVGAAVAEAKRTIAELRERETDLALGVEDARQQKRVAEARRTKLMARVAAGEDVAPAAVAEATAAIAEAGTRIAMRREALPLAEAATKAAERDLASVLTAELRRRSPLAKARSEAARKQHFAALEEWNRMDVLAADLLRAAGGIGDLEYLLNASADLAAARALEAA